MRLREALNSPAGDRRSLGARADGAAGRARGRAGQGARLWPFPDRLLLEEV